MTSELIFVGLGLSGTDGMTVKALEALKTCDKIYAEFFTSFLIGTKPEDLEKAIGKKIHVLYRGQVEESEDIINDAMNMRVGFITAGDTMAATTHVDPRIQAKDAGIPVRIFLTVRTVSLQREPNWPSVTTSSQRRDSPQTSVRRSSWTSSAGRQDSHLMRSFLLHPFVHS